MKLLRDLVLVEQIEAKKTTSSGIIIPETALSKPNEGYVRSIGPKVDSFKEGDKVIFPESAGHGIQIDGVDMLIMQESSIFAKISEDDI